MKANFLQNEIPQRFYADTESRIDGYEILGRLGEGTFGIVYKVKDKSGAIFALKLLKLWEVVEQERATILVRFVREFDIGHSINLNSPYLLRTIDYGKVKGNPYLLMEFCEGGSLDLWVGRFNSHPNKDRIVYQTLKGLHELHTMGYFHRDIKPNNILLTASGDAKVADFGIAGHKTSRLTERNIFGQARQLFGTWAYIAPEQANNKVAFKALDAVADIFSFGVTMFELFTGELPFAPYRIESDSDLVEYISNVRTGNARNLQNKRHMLPEKWIPVLEGCLHPDYQNKRYKSVNDIILALKYKSIDLQKPQYISADKYAIMVTYGEETNEVYPLQQLLNGRKGRILTMGRKDHSVKNDIEIKEIDTTYISRRHATIEYIPASGSWIIRDGQSINDSDWRLSVNGLYINSKEAGKNGLPLKYGDIITMGDTVLKVVSIP